jgi:acetoin utilization deacetylase AcuC-like enzyme
MKIISQPLGNSRWRGYAPLAQMCWSMALGLDAHENDPFHGFKMTTAGFARIAAAIAAMDLPAVIVQEGGYLSTDLGDNLTSFLNGYEAG